LHNLPWAYPKSVMDGTPFTYERDAELINQLKEAIQARL